MTAPRFLLHGIWLSGPTYKVALFLALAGEPFDFELVNLREGAHKAPGYVARQRYGQVPLLEDRSNGRGLCQAASILEYLADVTGKMGGATLDERIRAREWMFWDYDRFAVPIYRCRGVKLGFRQAPEEAVAMWTAEGEAALAVLDGHLQGRDFLVGEGPTMADVDLYGVASYAEAGGFSLEARPALRAWMARIEALPGFGPPEAIVPKETRLTA
ncbi:glutathione S-transferase family protein [Salinarimonas rosea]|uniref:glutathione S-transferase family protein n=1 Tax=Salinarimonas rosea TaxID=552063 RepID=UPI000410FDD8|nr:glutathione S-transferase family protein [Salinarimonas rosea]